jgi:hypothetical protein
MQGRTDFGASLFYNFIMLTKVQGEPNTSALSYVGQHTTENSKVPFCMIFARGFYFLS